MCIIYTYMYLNICTVRITHMSAQIANSYETSDYLFDLIVSICIDRDIIFLRNLYMHVDKNFIQLYILV